MPNIVASSDVRKLQTFKKFIRNLRNITKVNIGRISKKLSGMYKIESEEKPSENNLKQILYSKMVNSGDLNTSI